MHSCARTILLTVLIVSVIWLGGCGGGGNAATATPAAPTFTSTPVTAAAEGSTYTYELAATDPSGGSVSYSMTSAPAGASLSGSTITWTPTADQSRKVNSFTVTATTSKGGSARQTWTVTPDGTVRVNWVDNYWDENGPTNAPHDWTQLSPDARAAVLVQKTDGSLQTITGTADANGQVAIPNVPGGYYWLRVSPVEWYWTNANSFDFGADYNLPNAGLTIIGEGTPTTFNFNVTGVEPATTGYVSLGFERGFGFSHFLFNNETNFTASYIISSNIDWSTVKTATALEYKGISLGESGGVVLGPTAMLKDLALTSGATNNIDVALQPSPVKSFDLSIKGSAWVPLFAKVAPGTATPYSTLYDLSTDPDVKDALPVLGRNIRLMQPNMTFGWTSNGVGISVLGLRRSSCSGYPMALWSVPGPLPPFTPPLIVTDQNYGNISYGDPFPETWTRYFEICQQAVVDVPAPDGSSTPVQMLLSNGVTMAVPTAPVAPMVGPVENPTINDSSLYLPGTFTGPIKLKWTKPNLGTPKGYIIRVMTPTTFDGPSGPISAYMTRAFLGTATTEVTLPSTLLVAGKTYLFEITAIVDARINMELSPRRTGVPMANADIISAPITIGGAAN